MIQYELLPNFAYVPNSPKQQLVRNAGFVARSKRSATSLVWQMNTRMQIS